VSQRQQVHKLCQEAAPKILADFKPQLIIAIGGGGYVPARILRSFLKQPGSPNIPIQAIGLSLYERLSGTTDDDAVEAPGTKVTRTQWLDMTALGEMANLVGKRVLIVDEVDDTRTTLEYAVKELEKDVEEARAKMGSALKTEFGIFVLHVRPPSRLFSALGSVLTGRPKQNKDKPKKGTLPENIINGRYLAARTVGDEWICYPWEAMDIDEHDQNAAAAKAKKGL
jgi:hypoxanthine phosphoribosyltransferase